MSLKVENSFMHEDNENVKKKYEIYQCNLCKYKTFFGHNLTRHLNTHRENNCSQCGKSFKTSERLKYHENNHKAELDNKKKFTCDECSIVLASFHSLQRHCRNIHSKHYQVQKRGPKVYQCPSCDYKTRKKNNFERHLASPTVHVPPPSRPEDISCPTCDYTTKIKSNFVRHLERCDLKNTLVISF